MNPGFGFARCWRTIDDEPPRLCQQPHDGIEPHEEVRLTRFRARAFELCGNHLVHLMLGRLTLGVQWSMIRDIPPLRAASVVRRQQWDHLPVNQLLDRAGLLTQHTIDQDDGGVAMNLPNDAAGKDALVPEPKTWPPWHGREAFRGLVPLRSVLRGNREAFVFDFV